LVAFLKPPKFSYDCVLVACQSQSEPEEFIAVGFSIVIVGLHFFYSFLYAQETSTLYTAQKNVYSIFFFSLCSVWQKLEEENAEFFRSYYIRLKLKKQIILFNHLLEHQYHLMKYPVPLKVPLAPMQNGIHPVPGNFLPSY
jgi:uncharacterized protein (TIGR01589 family)